MIIQILAALVQQVSSQALRSQQLMLGLEISLKSASKIQFMSLIVVTK
jgi:hypothetical protein